MRASVPEIAVAALAVDGLLVAVEHRSFELGIRRIEIASARR